MRRSPLLVFLLIAAYLPLSSQRSNDAPYRGWPAYGGGNDNIRYSSLRQIDTSNVNQLEVAWTFRSGDAFQGSEMQFNPLVRNGVLFAATPKLRIVALNAATGELLWDFNPNPGASKPAKTRIRGVNFWGEGEDARVFFASEHWLYALNARTGKPVATFGDKGRLDLRDGLGRESGSFTISLTTPGVVYNDLLIIGSITSEDLPAAPGDIRAYDVRSGKLRWIFHTIPRPGEFGYDSWPKDAWKRTGGANNWAGLSLDEKRGIVFVPTGSAAFDFYGGDRHGDNLFANCLIALDASSGKRIWHFQFVKHDVWDRDLPAPPSLVTIRRNGQEIEAVAQITKSGHVFVFERATGKPVFPIRYNRVPASDVPGEQLAIEQALPLAPPPFARQEFTPDMVTRRTPEAQKIVRERFDRVRSGPQFTPPSLQGTVIFPGFDGGGEWGGAAFDPASNLLYVNSNEMPWILRLVPRKVEGRKSNARELYQNHCASCHRPDLKGTPPEFPSLEAIGSRRTSEDVSRVIRKGAGRMPPFAQLGDDATDALTSFLISGENKEVITARANAAPRLPYHHDGYNRFHDPEGYPAITPPWGTLNAINLAKGTIEWTIPLGEYPALAKQGITNTGSENYGGPVVTAGGLLFIGATNFDKKFRAFDKATGKLLWSTDLPAAGNATPAVYEVNGRQFVVIAAGGGKSGAPSGGDYVAFALPQK